MRSASIAAGEERSAFELDHALGPAGHEESRAFARQCDRCPSQLPSRSPADTSSPPLRIFAGAVHCLRIRQRRRIRHVDAFLPELIVLGAVEQHHVLLEIRVPVNRRSPEHVVRARAIVKRLLARTSGVPAGYVQPTSPTRLRRQPGAVIPDRWPSPPADRDRPRRAAPPRRPASRIARVLAEVEIDVLAVASSAAVTSPTPPSTKRFAESQASVPGGASRTMPRSSHVWPLSVDRIAPMRGNWRSGRPHTSAGPFVMVVAVPGPVFVGMIASIHTPCPGCDVNATGPSSRNDSSDAPDVRTGTPPHELITNSRCTPSTSDHDGGIARIDVAREDRGGMRRPAARSASARRLRAHRRHGKRDDERRTKVPPT